MRQSRWLFILLFICSVVFADNEASQQANQSRVADPDVPASMFDYNLNKLYRGYVDNEDISHVDPFTGNMTIHLPLINVPGNDGLSLKVTLTFDNQLQYMAGVAGTNHFGWGWSDNVGLYGGDSLPAKPLENASYFNPIFVDPDGNKHQLYSLSPTCNFNPPPKPPPGPCSMGFYSTDNWHANLTIDGWLTGTIFGPDGIQYTIEPGGGLTITSPNGGTVIHYTYDGTGNVASISRNDGYRVSFVNTPYQISEEETLGRLDSMSDNTGKEWHFWYKNVPIDSHGYLSLPTLTALRLPDGSQWSFSPGSNGEYLCVDRYGEPCPGNNNILINRIQSPTGLITHYSYGINANDSDRVQYYRDRVAAPYVTSKTISGVGVPTASWSYSFPNMDSQYDNESTITGPDSKTVYTFELVWAFSPGDVSQPVPTASSGSLLSESIYDLKGDLLQSTVQTWKTRRLSDYQPSNIGADGVGLNVPILESKTITRNGGVYKTIYGSYDWFGYPAMVTETSSSGTRTHKLTYYENTDKNIFKVASDIMSDGSGAVVNQATRSFDSHGNMTAIVVNGVETQYSYDSSGNITGKADAEMHETDYDNYVAGLPTVTRDPMHNVTTMKVNLDGTIASITDPSGKTTSYTYDGLHRLTSITPPIHLPTTLTWSNEAGGTEVIIQHGDHVTDLKYNSLGKLISEVNSDGDSAANIITKEYDALSRMVYQSYPTAPGATETGITYVYDPLNRVTESVNAGQYTTEYAYNDAQNSVAITDPNSHVTTYTYQAFGNPDEKQLIKVMQPNDVVTDITRTVNGLITAIAQNGYTRNYVYNENQYLVSETNPETGTTMYGRDLLGNMTSKQVGSATQIKYGYNPNNQLADVIYQDANGQQVIHKYYDPNGRLVRTSNTSNGSTWDYLYDSNGNLVRETLTYNNLTYPFVYTYNDYDYRDSAIFPNGTQVQYTVNSLGQVVSILPYIPRVAYFADNRIQTFTAANGVTTSYTENERNMRDSILVKKGTTVLVSKDYTYDGVGNVLKITDNVNGANSETMDYDEVNRLVSANGPWGTGSYTYDANNNIIKQTLGVNSSTYNYDEDTNLLKNITGANAQIFNYAAGNTIQIGNLNLVYNGLNQVTQMTGTNAQGQAVNDQHSYDGNENRLITINNDGTALEAYNEQLQLMYKANLTKNNQVAYVNLAGETLVRMENDGGTNQVIYLVNNLLGSPLDATDSSGASMQWTERYRPYGDEMDPITTRDNPHIGYTGKPHNVQTGLSYYGARYYYPSIGRFLSIDPAAVKPEMPITFNRYAYAANNPYAYKDNDGREFISAVVGGVIGGIEGYHDTHSAWGVAAGILIGGAVGFADPAASRLVTGLAVKGLARVGAEFATSATINTGGNMLYSHVINGSFNPGASLVGGLMGGMGGIAGGKIAKGAFDYGATVEGAVGNLFRSPSGQNTKAKVSEGFAATLGGTLNVAGTNAASNTNHDNKANNTGGSNPNASGSNNNAGSHSNNNSTNQG